MLGRDITRPGEYYLPSDHIMSPENMVKNAQENREEYRRKHYQQNGTIPAKFETGDHVWIRNHTAQIFEPTWLGPYIVADVRGDTTYGIKKGARVIPYHIDDLRRHPTSTNP